MNKLIHLQEVLTAEDIDTKTLRGATVEYCEVEETDFDIIVSLVFRKGNKRYALNFCTCGDLYFGEDGVSNDR